MQCELRIPTYVLFLESGSIEFEEFRTVFQPPTRDELLLAFRRFDKNKDGVLSPDEVKDILKSTNQPATDRNVMEMIKALDANGDGKINYKGVYVDGLYMGAREK